MYMLAGNINYMPVKLVVSFFSSLSFSGYLAHSSAAALQILGLTHTLSHVQLSFMRCQITDRTATGLCLLAVD